MVNLVLRFVGIARSAGLRISTSEVLDCLTQMQMVDIAEEPQFAAVLRANFAKSHREQHHFDRLYHMYFHELRQDTSIAGSEPLGQQIQDILQALAPAAGENKDWQAVLDFLDANPQPYFEQLGQIGSGADDHNQGPGANLGAVTQRLEIMLALNAVEKALAQFSADHRDEIDWEIRRDLNAHFKDRLDSARRLLTQDEGTTTPSADKNASYRQRLDHLGEIHFASLTQKEVATMREVIEQLVRKLKDSISRRYARQNRGVLDIKKTLRRAAGYQGIPVELFYRNRPLRKSKIVALCDVSGSVWSAARFMLNMLYSLQECFTQVRSFVFVAGLAEVTHVFENFEINQAIEKILKEADIEYNAATDYGLTFRQFKNRHMDMLNKKTTLIIIGDGRSNYGNPEEGILDEMRDRSRRVIWLNPETPYFWYTGDSEMRTYMECCDEVRPCQNLNQLLDFIESLVL
ncbi:MAG: VWA domain-containing protein [Desulfobacterales bacterium]|nr:VWA domain-containing protein [Desulfobacterales bacterium]